MKKLNYLRYLWRNNKYRGKNMRKKPIVAIIYDFDGTSRLSPTRRPHHCPLPHLLSCAHHIQVPSKKVNRAGEKFSPGGRGQPTASESGRCLPNTSSRDSEDEGDGRRAERSSAE